MLKLTSNRGTNITYNYEDNFNDESIAKSYFKIHFYFNFFRDDLFEYLSSSN